VTKNNKTLTELYATQRKYNNDAAEKYREREALLKDCDAANSRVSNNYFIEKQIEDCKSQLIPVTDAQLELANTSIEELEAKEAELQTRLSKLEANHQYEEKINNITTNKFKAENELEALKLLIKRTDANNMQTEIAALPFAEFTDKMNEIIPELFGQEVSFHINLESKANSFSFGIAKYPVGSDDIYIPYDLMSSGEKTLLAFALMSYIAQNSSSQLKLVMIDDMLDHLDDANVNTLFNKFADANIQIINAGVKSVDNNTINIIEI
jgi:DNA repair exonuclease SbcCD ATPase subunit